MWIIWPYRAWKSYFWHRTLLICQLCLPFCHVHRNLSSFQNVEQPFRHQVCFVLPLSRGHQLCFVQSGFPMQHLLLLAATHRPLITNNSCSNRPLITNNGFSSCLLLAEQVNFNQRKSELLVAARLI